MEADAEAQRLAERRKRIAQDEAEKTGETLVDLAVKDYNTGLGGRYLVEFVKRNRNLPLPWNRLRLGAPVVVSSSQNDDASFGVVSRRSQRSLQVALEQWPEGDTFRIDLSPDEVTRKRQLVAMNTALTARGRRGRMRDILLGNRAPRFRDESPCDFLADLNPSQQAAVRFGLASDDIAIVHGPPGTGKTTTVVELICQAVQQGMNVLACAPSNTAVDNLLERLVRRRQRVVRLGHPARVAKVLQQHSLDALVEAHEHAAIIDKLLRQAESYARDAGRYRRARVSKHERYALRREAKACRAEARKLERLAIDQTIDGADVVCATTTLDDSLLGDREFDLLVIDEACQSTEPGCWVPVLRARQLVLAGDPYQLPPTVVSREAATEGFSKSLMERLMEHYGHDVTRRLEVQYRMHRDIMHFSSAQFYEASLTADETVEAHVLRDLKSVNETELTGSPLTFIDTAGSGWEEELEPDGESKLNRNEAALVLRKVDQLVEAGLSPRDIAVIAPYAAQVRLLRANSEERDLEVDTVDGFQGREKEAVVISLVRSNPTQEIGFLGDIRRMNVAMTRARRKLIVIGDSATLGTHPFYAAMLEYFEGLQAYRTVWEEGCEV